MAGNACVGLQNKKVTLLSQVIRFKQTARFFTQRYCYHVISYNAFPDFYFSQAYFNIFSGT
jgi:hypothetical protein